MFIHSIDWNYSLDALSLVLSLYLTSSLVQILDALAIVTQLLTWFSCFEEGPRECAYLAC